MTAKGAVDTGRHFSTTPVPSGPHIAYGTRWLNLLEGNFDPLPLSPTGMFHATGEIEVDISAVKIASS